MLVDKIVIDHHKKTLHIERTFNRFQTGIKRHKRPVQANPKIIWPRKRDFRIAGLLQKSATG